MGRANKKQAGYRVTNIFLDIKALLKEIDTRVRNVKKFDRIWYGDAIVMAARDALLIYMRGYNNQTLTEKVRYFKEVMDKIEEVIILGNILVELRTITVRDMSIFMKYAGSIKTQLEDFIKTLEERIALEQSNNNK